MTAGSAVGVLATLLVVLALLAAALRALRRVAVGAGAARGPLPLEVVQRLPLGPRQGIAVVRVGTRFVAVSVGEGGVRPVAELDEKDAMVLESARRGVVRGAWSVERSSAPEAGTFAPRPDFLTALRRAARQAMPLAVVAALALAPAPARAQQPVPAAPAAAQAATPAGGPLAVARVDTMVTRLAPQIDLRVGDAGRGGLRLSGTVGVVIMMGLLTLLPTLLLMMTGFTRILIVLHFLRQALGTQSAPPAHLVAALALLLTGFVMAPTLREVNRTALEPWLDGRIEQAEMLATGAKPFREFMLRQTRDSDLQAFLELSDTPEGVRAEDAPLVVVMSAFVTSELRTAFQIGFALFLPFIVIDVVVSAVLMSMGMFMLPPAMISLPFKLLLFVLVDGWTLVVQGLVRSFA